MIFFEYAEEVNKMAEFNTQKERLDYLVQAFIDDSEQYKNLKVPGDPKSKREVLRSLMNIRMPYRMKEEVLDVQDTYLQQRNRENGIVRLSDLSSIKEEGSHHPYGEQIYLWQGDITRLGTDAIVNAANSQMLGCFVPMHTCIDNCIHTYAGIQLRAECAQKMRELRLKYGDDYEQPTAVPMLTQGYNLPAKHVIHVVGPIVQDRLTEEHERLLAQCYRSCLEMADENHLESIAFCCISTGVFMFTNQRAAEIAVETVTKYLDETGSRIKAIFNVFKDIDLMLYKNNLCEPEAE
jgi:O-acetyl-ADP-ribose deacetylase (regulator of RNase III)